MMTEKIVRRGWLLAAALACGWVNAGTYHWTGAVDGAWVNPANWQENAVPGRYDKDGVRYGALGDVAVFGDTLTGNKVTAIDFTGVYSVSEIVTTGTTQYTYGTAADQYVPIEPWGTFSAAETAQTPPALLQAKLRLGVECMATNWGDETMIIRNNSAQEFVIGEWGFSTVHPERPTMDPHNPAKRTAGGEPGVQLEGTGDIRLADLHVKGVWGSVLFLKMTGKLTVDAETSVRRLSVQSASSPMEIEITARGSIAPYSCYNWLDVARATTVTGAGTFYFGVCSRGTPPVGAVCDNSINAPVTFYCPVKTLDTLEMGPPPADYLYRYCAKSGSNGVVKFRGGCDFKGVLWCWAYAYGVYDFETLGLRGTYGDMGDIDFLLGSAKLIYSGPGEVTDRAITVVTNQYKRAEVTLEQAGTGTWTVNSAVTTVPDIPANDLNFVLDGGAATEGVFGGTLPSELKLKKSGQGMWTFNPANAYAGAVTLAAGKLVWGYSAHVPSVTASGNATLVVAADATLEIDTLGVTSGRKLDFVPMPGARVKVNTVAADTSLGDVQVYGHAAVLDADGWLGVDANEGNIWKAAASGDWDDPGNWAGGALPDLTRTTWIDAPGGDYTVKADGLEVVTTNLNLRNAGGGTVTLLVTNGADFTVKGHTTSQNILTMGEGARVRVTDATFRLVDQGNAKGYISNRSALSFDRGAEIQVNGTGTFTMRGIVAEENTDGHSSNLNTQFEFGAGRVTLTDDAVFTVDNGTGSVFYHTFSPLRAGETSILELKGNSRFNFPKAPYQLKLGGRAGVTGILEIDTDWPNEMTGLWPQNHVGCMRGMGIYRLKKGRVCPSNWDAFYAGTTSSDGLYSSGSAVGLATTGRVEIAAGAVFKMHGKQGGLSTSYSGFVLGHGIASKEPRGSAVFHGEMDLAGTFTKLNGVTIIGAGPDGTGVWRQTGTADVVAGGKDFSDYYPSGVFIGLYGGVGTLTLADGAFTTARPVFVGGALPEDFAYNGQEIAHANAELLTQYHDARGTLTVTGGVFSTAMDITLGKDGTGVLELGGTGRVSAAAIVVKRTAGQPASELRFTADRAGRCGTVAAATRLVFEDGADATVTVDVSAAVAADKARVVVWNLENAPEGLDNVTVELVGADELRVPNRLALSDGGRTLMWTMSRGTVLILK